MLAIHVVVTIEHTVLTGAAATTGVRSRVGAAGEGTHPWVTCHLRVVTATLCAGVI